MKQQKDNWVKILFSFAAPCKGKMALSVFCAILSVAGGFIPFWAVYEILLAFINQNVTLNGILIWCLVGAAGYLLRVACHGISTILAHISAYTILEGIRLKIADRLMKAPLGEVMGRRIGYLKNIIMDKVEDLEPPLAHMIPELTSNLLLPVAIFTWMMVIDWRMGLAVLIAPVLAMEDMSGSAIEYIRGLSIVKSFGQEGASIESFRKANTDLKNIHIKVEKGYTPFNCLHLFSLKLASMGIVFICAWQTLNGQMSLAYFLMFVLFSFVIFGSVENINDAAHMLGLIDSAMNKLEALENAEYIDQDGKDITPTSYDITFQDVSFGYDKRTVLHDVNFTIPQNTTTAIVGPSGSGKSTLCSLIARFYDVDAGKIILGETDIREFTCDSLLKNISMVFQNVYLFRDTIRNNIKFGSPNASEEQMIAAAKKARCHDFIMALPDGYDTVIGEGGSSLSGGEKQRISIARAMLKDAPIVILDEATASIDPENEHLIQEAISALTHGKTIITIAHRLATIENADQILVIDGGTVVQKGTHKELLAQRGTYQEFIKIREQAEGWRIQQ